jgi:lysylphosphatidylglycerol synthetase-like protein (DUF2156 family)
LAIFATGFIALLDALTPPLRVRLHLLLGYLPLSVPITASVLLAFLGLVLIALSRGLLRGQRRAWRLATALLVLSIALHLLAGADFEEAFFSLAVLALLILGRRHWTTPADHISTRQALLTLAFAFATTVTIATASLVLYTHVDHDHQPLGLSTALRAVLGRLYGNTSTPLTATLNRFLSPTLLTLTIITVLVALYLLTRPIVDRRLQTSPAALLRARDIVARHGHGTLDYFALRSDKRWFFYRDSLIAYAVYSGVALVSPDPIGPPAESAATLAAFRSFAASHGWSQAVMGASEQSLDLYRTAGMHDIYIGDEAVVDVQSLSLAGGSHKSLRQAVNRVRRAGYTASFYDPASLPAGLADSLTAMLGLSRRGTTERGFSMMLGRVFDPHDTGLLLCVVRSPLGDPVAICQYVPARSIAGYSLDLMRRDKGDHPNGLLDFALVETITYLKEHGHHGLSLNFAAMRATLAGEHLPGTIGNAQRWLLRRLGDSAQIESLWRFNAKYDPIWLPRYLIYDTPANLAPTLIALARAESLWEIPLLGRLFTARSVPPPPH